MSELKNASEAKLIKCIISRQGKDSKSLGKDMIIAFETSESVESPFCTAALTVSDSKNFINDYPIEGGENIMMEGWVNRTDLRELNLNSIRKIIKE